MFEEQSDYFYKKLYNKYGFNIRGYLYSNKNIILKYIEKKLSKEIDYDFYYLILILILNKLYYKDIMTLYKYVYHVFYNYYYYNIFYINN